MDVACLDVRLRNGRRIGLHIPRHDSRPTPLAASSRLNLAQGREEYEAGAFRGCAAPASSWLCSPLCASVAEPRRRGLATAPAFFPAALAGNSSAAQTVFQVMEELALGAWEHLNLAVWKNHSRPARWLAVCNLLVALQEEGADGAAAPSKAATLIYPRYIRTFVFSAVAILKLLCWASLRKESRSLTAAEAARGSSSRREHRASRRA